MKNATDRAKEKYRKAEPVFDELLIKWTRRLIDSPYTLAIVVAVCLLVVAWRFL